MATALDIIKRSMRLVGALGAGETPSADEQTDGLAALNAMLESWSIRKLSVYRLEELSITWTGGTASRTIGATGDLVADRPIEIHSGRQRLLGIDYPLRVVTREEWDGIVDKNTDSTIAQYVWYDATLPNGTVYVWPVPSAASVILLRAVDQLSSFSAATTVAVFPPGYQRAIEFNLAVDLAPEYQRVVPTTVERTAAATLRELRRINHKTPRAVDDLGLITYGRASAFNWITGD